MGLAIELDQATQTVVMRLSGVLDYWTAPNLEAQMSRLLTHVEETGAQWVMLDTEDLDFLDMSGIRALTTCWREIQASGVKGVALIADRTPVMSSYRWTKLHELLPIYRTQEEAMSQLSGMADESAEE